jgi:hypothetical protein
MDAIANKSCVANTCTQPSLPHQQTETGHQGQGSGIVQLTVPTAIVATCGLLAEAGTTCAATAITHNFDGV